MSNGGNVNGGMCGIPFVALLRACADFTDNSDRQHSKAVRVDAAYRSAEAGAQEADAASSLYAFLACTNINVDLPMRRQ